MANLIINTTQNIPITFYTASLGKRISAFLLDMLFIVLYIILVIFIAFRFSKDINWPDSFGTTALALLVFSPVFTYSFIFEILLQGYTPGKKILHIKVVKIDGQNPTVVDYFIRWIMRIVDIWSFSGILGVSCIAASGQNQRLGDMLASTAVIDQLAAKHSLKNSIYQDVEDLYTPVYLEVLNFNDKDMGIIKKAYDAYLKTKNPKLLSQLVDKIQNTIKIDKKNYTDIEFVQVVLKDYNYLTARV